MTALTVTQAQKIHFDFFGFEHTDHGILHLLKEAKETLILCKEEVTPESMEDLLILWFKEEQMESDADWSHRSRLMLDDA